MGSVSAMNGFIKRNRTVFVMGLIALFIAGTADLFAGLLMENMEAYLTAIPGMMILIYSAIGMRGNIYGAMGSRLGTAMHMGTFRTSFKKGSVLRANLDATMALTMCLSIAMGILTWVVAKTLFDSDVGVFDFVFISTLGGIMAGFVVMFFNIIIAKEGFKRDWDIDNISAPLIAAIGDIVTMPMIFVSTWLFFEITKLPMANDILAICGVVFFVLSVVYVISIFREKKSKRDYSGEARRIVAQSIPMLLLCLVFEIGAGMVIQEQQENLVEFSVLLIMLTAFLNEGNALSGMLTSRLSSMIHLGTMKTNAVPSAPALENFLIMYICAGATYFYIGVVSFVAAYIINGASVLPFGTTMAIIMIAGLLTTTLLNFLSYYVAILATKFGLDPDDHSIPITSSVMDLAGSIILMIVIMLFI